jgi:hypothetical protein
MPRQQSAPRIRAEVRDPAEMTESQVGMLLNLGREEAALLDRLEAATRAGNKDEVWKIAQEYCGIEDKITEV